jgi:hypothetical protein
MNGTDRHGGSMDGGDPMGGSVFTSFADGQMAEYRINTSRNQVAPSARKSPTMLGRIKFCKDRIFEKELQVKHRGVVNRLEAMENPREYTTDEQLRLYKVFLDQLTNAVTSPSGRQVDSFIGQSEAWIA